MTNYHLLDKDTLERGECLTKESATKWAKERIKKGHEVTGNFVEIGPDGKEVKRGAIVFN